MHRNHLFLDECENWKLLISEIISKKQNRFVVLLLFVMATGMKYAASSIREGEKRCVARGPNGISCGNSQHTPGMSIHHFPDINNDHNGYRQGVQFIRRHWPNWTLESKQSILCRVPFNDSNFTPRRYLAVTRKVRGDSNFQSSIHFHYNGI